MLSNSDSVRAAVVCNLDTELRKSIHIDVVETRAHELHEFKLGQQLLHQSRGEFAGAPSVWNDRLRATKRDDQLGLRERGLYLPHLHARLATGTHLLALGFS